MIADLAGLISALETRHDNAYVAYIELCRVDACLGFEAKIENSLFGSDELKAHERAAEKLGEHRAYRHVIKELRELHTSPPVIYDTGPAENGVIVSLRLELEKTKAELEAQHARVAKLGGAITGIDKLCRTVYPNCLP